VRLAQRVLQAAPYPFAALSRRAQELGQAGRRVVNLSIGDPDTPPPPEANRALRELADEPEMHRYPDYAGHPELRQAVATYYRRRFGVELDPKREVVGLIGSKEGIAHLLWAVLDPGAVALLPDPAYPVYEAQTRFVGARPVRLPLTADRGFLPDLSRIPEAVWEDARILLLNYPNAPTGAVAPPSFWEEAVELARRHGVLLVNDGAYLDVSLSGPLPTSVLAVPGAREVAVEFYSLSKTFHLTGWRLAAAVGQAQALEGLRTIKENTDSGQWTPLQRAGARLLADPSLEAYVRAENERLQRRAQLLAGALEEAGLGVSVPSATLYLWVPAPQEVGGSGDALAQRWLEEAGVLVTPGSAFSPAGKAYVRLSLTAPDDQVEEAARALRAWRPR
jgi:LL-diaminopimelate aminotransferase